MAKTVLLVQRHVRAARAFHTGLVSETQRHLYVLRAFERHIDVLRDSKRGAPEQLDAARQACRDLRQLEQLKRPWRETYRDFRRSLSLVCALLDKIVATRG